MYLSKFQVQNYKSFRNSGKIEFKQGINIIVGQNNSGKTALLEALSLNFEQKIHESIKTKPIKNGQGNNDVVYTDSSIEFKSEEIKQIFKLSDFSAFKILSQTQSNFEPMSYPNPGSVDFELEKEKNVLDFQNIVDDHNNLYIHLENKKYYLFQYGDYLEETPVEDKLIDVKLTKDGKFYSFKPDEGNPQLFSYKINKYILKNIYRFYAIRINDDERIRTSNEELLPDASNLAEVLNALNTTKSGLYRRYIQKVREVIPSIKWVSTPPKNDSENKPSLCEIKIWNVEEDTDRDDLAIPLSDCGTGVVQVLAILYVVMTSKDTPKILLIDEPNSFLHPAASKKLIQILNQFPQHQYFISTHSPEIVTASNPETLTMLRYEDGETKVEQIDLSNSKGVKGVFKELGIDTGTFAFANHILWVEGETEEKAFKLLLEAKGIKNIIIKPTVASGFRQKGARFQNVRHFFNLHKSISATDSVISPRMTILLDREIGKETENADLIREFGEDKFNFIQRAMYENYLLDAEAINYILHFTKETENYSQKLEEITNLKNPIEIEENEISVEAIEKWIEENKNEFIPDKYKQDSDWLVNIDGAKLLDSLFKHFLGKPFGYEPYKIIYGEKLTQWFLANKPEQLKELQDELENLLKEKQAIR